MIENAAVAQQLSAQLEQVGDLERIISKVAVQRISPRDLLQLSRALKAVQEVRKICLDTKDIHLEKLAGRLNDCIEVVEAVDMTIKPDAPLMLNKGGVISDGVDQELDQLRKIAFSGKDYLLDIQRRESEKTGIPSSQASINSRCVAST